MSEKQNNMTETEQVELEQLRSWVPNLFTPGTCLYIGARPNRYFHAEALKDAGKVLSLLEVWPANISYFCCSDGPFEHIICGDVRAIDVRKKYDAVFWWHGPEHIHKAELQATLMKLEAVANLVVLGCPWGIFPQDDLGGNPYENHVSALYFEDFTDLGYQVVGTGIADRYSPESTLLAWKEVDHG